MQKLISKISLGLISFLLLALPVVAMAQTDTTVLDTWGCEALKEQIENNTPSSGYNPRATAELPEYCNEGQIYSKIVYWMYYIIGIGGVIMLIYGGYIYMTAGSNESQTKKGKNILLYTIAGIAVAIIATTIIRVIINLTVDNKIF